MKKKEDFASNEAPTTGSIPSTATKPQTATLTAGSLILFTNFLFRSSKSVLRILMANLRRL
jgi:hypothetical protein